MNISTVSYRSLLKANRLLILKKTFMEKTDLGKRTKPNFVRLLVICITNKNQAKQLKTHSHAHKRQHSFR